MRKFFEIIGIATTIAVAAYSAVVVLNYFKNKDNDEYDVLDEYRSNYISLQNNK